MSVRPINRKQPAVQKRPPAALLRYGFWILTSSLILHQLLVVVPAYRGGLLPAYAAGWAIKDLSFSIPIYTPYSIVTNLLFVPVLLLIAFVRWVAPVLTLIWGVQLARLWHELPGHTKWIWAATMSALWVLTLLTTAASAAFLIWLLD